jgi:hypothetical protein
LANYTHLLFGKGQMDEARSVLGRVLVILDAEHPTELNAECWMYAYCDCAPMINKDALTALKRLVVEFSIRTGEWDFSKIIAQAINANHIEMKWLPRLVEVLAGRAPIETLEPWAAWNAA